jgi:hypothetical protein
VDLAGLVVRLDQAGRRFLVDQVDPSGLSVLVDRLFRLHLRHRVDRARLGHQHLQRLLVRRGGEVGLQPGHQHLQEVRQFQPVRVVRVVQVVRVVLVEHQCLDGQVILGRLRLRVVRVVQLGLVGQVGMACTVVG